MTNPLASFPPLVQIGIAIIILVLLGGVLRFLLRLAWRLVGCGLTLVIVAVLALFLSGVIRLH